MPNSITQPRVVKMLIVGANPRRMGIPGGCKIQTGSSNLCVWIRKVLEIVWIAVRDQDLGG